MSIANSRSTLRLTSIESVMPSSHLILCRPLLLLPPIPPSNSVFSNESTLLMRWPKYWSFSFSIIPSKEMPGPISFRMDWLDLLAVAQLCPTLCNPMDCVACQAPLFMGFFSQEYWSGLPFPSPGDGSSPPRGRSHVTCIGRQNLYH